MFLIPSPQITVSVMWGPLGKKVPQHMGTVWRMLGEGYICATSRAFCCLYVHMPMYTHTRTYMKPVKFFKTFRKN